MTTELKTPTQLKTLQEFNDAKTNNKLMVVDFTATWCPPCQMIGPKFSVMATSGDYEGVTFVKIDVDENAQASEAAGITCMPTFQFYKDGAKVDELQGADEGSLKAKTAALRA